MLQLVDKMEQFEFMKQCLTLFNYPRIHSMDHEEVGEIFADGNRVFLVKWILHEMNENYVDILENITNEELADIIDCHGFCDSSQKYGFINGTLDFTQQVVILNRMLKHLKDGNAGKSLKSNKFSMKDVEECVNFNANLFPNYGPKKTLTVEQKHKKVQEYKQEIEELKQLTSNSECGTKITTFDATQIDNLSHSLESLSNNLKEVKKKVLEDTEGAVNAQPPQFGQNLTIYKNHINDFLTMVKNKNTIADFGAKTIEAADEQLEKQISHDMLREIDELCHEIKSIKP